MTDWSKLKVIDLKAELKRRGLPNAGLKVELVARLEASDGEPPQSGEEAEEEQQSQDAGDENPKDDEPHEAGEDGADAATEPVTGAAEPQSADHETKTEEKTADAHDAVPESAEANPNASSTSENTGETASIDAKEPVVQQVDGPNTKVTALGLPAVNTPSQPDSTAITEEVAKGTPTNHLPSDSALDSQKRKRRSASPPPSEEEMTRKRARAGDAINGEGAQSIETNRTKLEDPAAMDVVQESVAENAAVSNGGAREPYAVRDTQADAEGPPDEMDYERDVEPAIHPATTALYISNLMRPLRADDIQSHLASLASTTASDTRDDLIAKFYLDQIRTHAFVIFTSVSAASRVRTAMHDRVWPNESNRKALSVDFIPAEKIDEWIDLEESGGRRSSFRWEVVYRDGPEGNVEAVLESGVASNSRQGPPSTRPLPKVTNNSTNVIPVGPRSQIEMPPPTGPRAVRPGTGPGPRPPPSNLDHVVERTRAKPVISYQMVSEDLAHRRVDNMRSFYSRDTQRDLGREINRYSFEDGDSFVDRGKEIFEGIRPPHRDNRGGRRGGFGGRPPRRGGPPPFRQRSDRYLPGRGGNGEGGGRDERSSRLRYNEEDRSRWGDSARGDDYRDRRY